MPMSESLLKNEIIAAMTGEGFTVTDGNGKLAAAIAKAVVSHIKANAEVTGGVCAPAGPIAGGKVL